MWTSLQVLSRLFLPSAWFSVVCTEPQRWQCPWMQKLVWEKNYQQDGWSSHLALRKLQTSSSNSEGRLIRERCSGAAILILEETPMPASLKSRFVTLFASLSFCCSALSRILNLPRVLLNCLPRVSWKVPTTFPWTSSKWFLKKWHIHICLKRTEKFPMLLTKMHTKQTRHFMSSTEFDQRKD